MSRCHRPRIGSVRRPTSPESLYDIDPDHLGDVLIDEPEFRRRQLSRWLYTTPVGSTASMHNLPGELRRELADRLWPFEVELVQSADGGTTRKWLFRCHDGASIETVLMGYPSRTTLCISSQAGCAMACSFCATGQFGFERHLTAGEIVAQVAFAQASLREHPLPGTPSRISNVVFMGMGEPLANWPRLEEALRRMIDVMGMGARGITVSTVGVVPGIRALAETPWQVNLAVSLHAADDELRSKLVPLNDRYPLDELIAASNEYFAAKGRRVSIEWALIEDTNDNRDQAVKLAGIARRMSAHVNVIALNPTPLTPDRPPEADQVARFMAWLAEAGANATLRETRGRDIDAACGQLRIRGANRSG